jgi:hypothetical protein
MSDVRGGLYNLADSYHVSSIFVLSNLRSLFDWGARASPLFPPCSVRRKRFFTSLGAANS